MIRTGALLLLFVFILFNFSGCKRIRGWFKKSPSSNVELNNPEPESQNPSTTTPTSAPAPESQSTLPPPPAAPPPSLFGETKPSNNMPFGMSPESNPASTAPLAPPPSANTGTLSVSAGTEKKVSEGSYFLIDDAQALSPLGKPLTYQWGLAQGPADKIQIVKGDALQASFKILELNEVTPFVLRLSVSDGSEQASSDVKVLAYPAQLSLKSHLGGITRQVERLGEFTYVSRGRTLEIYDASFNLIAKVNLENPILELAAFSMKGKNYLYATTDSGEWWFIDASDPKNATKSLIQKSGVSFHDLKITSSGDEAFGLALEKDKAILWNLTNPAQPQLKAELKGSYQDLKKAILVGKKIYLADRNNINSIDGSTGILNAAIPAGGNITGLDVVENGGKLQLVASLGLSENKLAGDYGLRVFEISAGGKLTNEQRFRLKGNPPIEKMLTLPQSTKVLLAVQNKNRYELKAFDLATKTETPLDMTSDPKIAILLDMASGLFNNIPVAILADASALKVLKLSPVGSPASRLKVENLKTSYSTLAAGLVKLLPNSDSLYLMDFGSMQNPNLPALLEINSTDLSLKSSLVLGDASYFSDFALSASSKFSFAANLNDENPESLPQSLPASQPSTGPAASQPALKNTDGFLRAFVMDPKAPKSFLSSQRIFGGSVGANLSRPFGMDAKSMNGNIVLATAVAKVSGVGYKSGLYILRIPSTADPAIFLKGDLSQALTYLPLSDARDVKISDNGKWAFVAAGAEGIAIVDLEKNMLTSKQNPSPGATADRILISHDQKKIFASFLEASTVPLDPAMAGAAALPVSIYLYYLNEGQVGLWGNMKGLSSVTLPYAIRSGSFDLSADDIYLFVANGAEGIRVYNTSDPSSPVLINKLPTFGLAVSVAVGDKYKNIYIADLINGLEIAEFGF